MFASTLPPAGNSVLERLSNLGILHKFYLAGGTAAALQMGHRLSEDLDFFTANRPDTVLLKQRLQESGQFTLVDESWGTLHGFLENVKVSFFYYKYPLLFPPVSFLGCLVAQIKDIAPMKIEAIASRGSKKDFFDLYFINKEVASLEECLLLYRRKFAGFNFSIYHVLRSLTYFADAEKEKEPVLLQPVTWAEVKSHFTRLVPALLDTLDYA